MFLSTPMLLNWRSLINMCVCYRPPVRGVCTNDEVVEFQTWTVTLLEPRICCLLLRIYSCPAPPSLPTVRRPSRGFIPLLPQHPLHQIPSCIRTRSSAHLGVTYICPSTPMLPASPPTFDVCDPPLWPSLAPSTPAGFLSPPYPFLCQNHFYCSLQLLLRCRLHPPRHLDSTPSLINCLSHINAKTRP